MIILILITILFLILILFLMIVAICGSNSNHEVRIKSLERQIKYFNIIEENRRNSMHLD